jgi:hypothetical protein
MSGGGSDDPNVYSDAIFNRIRLAPTTVLIGFGIIYAILKIKKSINEYITSYCSCYY